MAKLTAQELIDAIKELSVLELNDLVKACEEEFGVSAAAGVVVAAAGPAEAAEEKTEFDVELTEVGAEKVKVIKVVREVTGLGLKEAKEKVDSAPQTIKEAAPEAEANEIKEKLEAAGAKVELKNNVNQDTTYNVSLQMMNDNGDWKDVDTIKVVVKAGDKYGFTPITGISANQQYRLVLGEFTCLLTAPNK